MKKIVNNTQSVNVANEIGFYLSDLKKEYRVSEGAVYLEAKETLVRTGVTTKNGNTRKKIVSWE